VIETSEGRPFGRPFFVGMVEVEGGLVGFPEARRALSNFDFGSV